jgi:hypothetical protein
MDLTFSPDGRRIYSGHDGGLIHVRSVETGMPLGPALAGHTGDVTGVAVTPDHQRLVSVAQDRTLRIRRLPGGETEQIKMLPTTLTGRLAMDPQGALIAVAGGAAREVYLWRLSDGKLLHRLQGHRNRVSCVAYSHGGKLVASAEKTGRIQLWQARSGRVIRQLGDHVAAVTGMAFSSDGQHLVSGSWDGTVRSWSIATGNVRRVLRVTNERVNSVALSPDGRRVAVVTSDGRLGLWQLVTGQRLADRAAHRGDALVVAFSPDGRYLASGGADGVVRLFHGDDLRPVWRTAAVLTSPPRVYTHAGWQELAAGRSQSARERGDQRRPIPRWQRLIEQRGTEFAVGNRGALLCALVRESTAAGRSANVLIAWDLGSDTERFRHAIDGADKLLVADDACVVLSGGEVSRFTDQGRTQMVKGHARVLSQVGSESWVVAQQVLYRLDRRGAIVSKSQVDVDVTAVGGAGDAVLVGQRGGSVQLLPQGPGSAQERGRELRAFSDTASDAVTLIEPGPGNTVIVGFANGMYGVWNRQGMRLQRGQIHGAVLYAVPGDRQSIWLISDVGESALLEMDVYRKPYCQLMEEVWRGAAVTWDGERLVQQPRPNAHPCAPGKNKGRAGEGSENPRADAGANQQ